ncbi:hypothetical protein BH23ACT12_BH23ACT12_14300 [soil metagenome]
MVRLHLVGFTTDLKNLIFADERGATSGSYVVSLDSRLRHTLEEVDRLDEDVEEYESEEPPESEEPEAPAAPRVVSKLSPKEIQSLLRAGKTEEQVARLAGTEVDWIRRFSFAILAERRDVIDAVRAATLSKPRLGPSGMTIGDAVEENLGAKRLRMGAEAIEEAWKAMRKNGRWQVSFEYESRGQKRLARYSFDPNTRQVEPLNDIALELGWRADSRSKRASVRPSAGGQTLVTGVRPTPRAPAKPAAKPAAPAKPSGRSAGGRAPDRPISAGTRPKPTAPATRRSTIAARSREEGARQEQPVPRRRLVSPSEEIERVKPPASPPEPDDTSDEFIIQRPRNPERSNPESPKYGSLPQVWRPTRRN